MTNLPRRPIKPLAPPPDAFDRVLATARRRRRIRGLIAASSTMAVVLVAAASFALGASINANDRIDPASRLANNPSPTADPTSADSPHPKPRPKKSRIVAGGGKSAVGGAPLTWLRGRAVDSSGNGIEGLFVEPGIAGAGTYSSDGRVAAVTDANGYYKIACPRAPVLLATWRINHIYAGQTAGGSWGATYVGSTDGTPVVPKCNAPRYTTTLVQGATLTGQVVDTGPCVPGDNYHLSLWLGQNKGTRIFLEGLYSGSTFIFSGLPAGTHTLGMRHQIQAVPVAQGASVDANVYFACDGTTSVPSGTTTQSIPPSSPPPSASATPTPSPTPSEPVIN
jgi:protocatechuate 3,4-dioxygenase beta subunit